MYRVTYLGLSKEAQQAKLDGLLAGNRPPEKRGQSFYTIKERDREELKEEKRDRVKAWKAKFRKEAEAEVEAADSQMEIRGVVLPKGKAVDVPESSPLCEVLYDKKTGKPEGPSKLESLVTSGVVKVEKVAGKALDPVPESVKEEKRGPGRPPKDQA